MPLTIGDLVDMPQLGLSLYAGASGLAREVMWTHSTDLPDPWQWLAGGELLMTNGIFFPADAEAQGAFVEQLDRNGASGLAIGEGMFCPPLTDAVARVADERGFPVLWIRYPKPFVGISRAVAEASLVDQSRRFARTTRIYNAIRRITEVGIEHSAVEDALATELQCPVHICVRRSGSAFFPDGRTPPTCVSDAVRREPTGERLVAGVRVRTSASGEEVLLMDVPTHDDAVLAIVRGRSALDSVLLQHAATVAALELSHSRLILEHRRRVGDDLLTHLLTNQLDPESGRRRLAEAGIDPANATVLMAAADEGNLRDLHVGLWRARVPHLVGVRADRASLLVAGRDRAVEVVLAELGPSARVGVSAPLLAVGRTQEAEREAEWLLGLARRDGRAVVRYGEPLGVVGMSSIEEARALVQRVLGPVLAHDAQHDGDLLATLRAYLEHDRSWQRTASALNLHRQTVLYRMRKAERLLGLELHRTPDLTLAWLALESYDLMSGAPGPS